SQKLLRHFEKVWPIREITITEALGRSEHFCPSRQIPSAWKKGKQSNAMAYTASNPNRSNHEWFEELCAAAAIGELASTEFSELQSHLASCDRCRAVYADFCKLSSEGLSILAVAGD